MITPRPYQLEILQNPTKVKCLVLHRGAGKTALAINKLILEAFKNKGLYLYLCPFRTMAKDIVWKQQIFNYLPDNTYKANEVDMSILLLNGSLILVRGTDDEDRLRGLTDIKGVIFDEAAFMPNLKEVYQKAVKPKALDAFIWFISTPNGDNYFKELCDTNYTVKKTVEDTNLISQERLESIQKETQQDFFRQEYYCDFLSNAQAFFRGVEQLGINQPSEPEDKQYVMGIDVGKKHDYTVCTVFERGTNKMVAYDRWHEIDYSVAKYRIASLARKYNARILIDSTGVGDVLFDELQNLGLPIEPYQFTQNSKKLLMNKLNSYIQQKFITLLDIPEMYLELKNFTYKVTENGIKMEAPQGQHDDTVCSLALAVWQLSEPTPIVEVSDRLWLKYNNE